MQLTKASFWLIFILVVEWEGGDGEGGELYSNVPCKKIKISDLFTQNQVWSAFTMFGVVSEL